MIGHHLRISIEESFPDAEDVGARHENDYQTDAEHDPECQYRIGVGMDDCERGKVHGPKLASDRPRRNCLRFYVNRKPALSQGWRPKRIRAVDAGLLR